MAKEHPVIGGAMSTEFVPLDALHPELRSRVMAATAHARPRVIRRLEVLVENVPSDEYEVYALAGDRFVYMVLSLRGDGSVAETTRTFLPNEIIDVTIEKDEATLEVEGPSGRQTIPVPDEAARALCERRI
jgi:hypothetical protein